MYKLNCKSRPWKTAPEEKNDPVEKNLIYFEFPKGFLGRVACFLDDLWGFPLNKIQISVL